MNRFWRGFGIWAVATSVVVINAGCHADALPNEQVRVAIPNANGATMPTDAKRGELEELGTWRGHWDGRRFSFRPLDARAESAPIRPRGFQQVDDSKFSFWTEEAIVVNTGPAPATPQDPDPICALNAAADPETYFADGETQTMTTTEGECTNQHLCANVGLETLSSRAVDKVYVEITDITSGFHGDGPSLASVPTGYPLSNALGLWSYGDIPPSGGYVTQQWDIFLPTCEDFDFTTKVMGALRRTSYTAATSTATTLQDACAFSGHQEPLVNPNPGDVATGQALPFPFTLYDVTFDTDDNPGFAISSRGTLGIGAPASGTNVSLPNASLTYTLVPFWDNISLSTGKVCSGLVPGDAVGSRRFVVTWKDAKFLDAGRPTTAFSFSAILYEGSDNVVFQYHQCSSNTFLSGSSATIGIEGTSTVATMASGSPPLPSSCPVGGGAIVTFTASPGSELP